MINKKLLLIPSLFVYLLSHTATAVIHKNDAENLITISGLSQTVDEIPKAFKSSFEQADEKEFTSENKSKILKCIDNTITATSIKSNVSLHMQKSLDNSTVKTLNNWYQSDLGKKITAIEIESSKPEAQTEMAQQASTLMANIQRVTQAKDIVETLDAADFLMDIQLNTSLAVIATMAYSKNAENSIDLNVMKPQLSKQVQQMRPHLEQYLILSTLYMYQDLSDEELNKYQKFLESPVYQSMKRSVMQGMSEGISNSIGNFTAQLSKLLKPQMDKTKS